MDLSEQIGKFTSTISDIQQTQDSNALFFFLTGQRPYTYNTFLRGALSR